MNKKSKGILNKNKWWLPSFSRTKRPMKLGIEPIVVWNSQELSFRIRRNSTTQKTNHRFTPPKHKEASNKKIVKNQLRNYSHLASMNRTVNKFPVFSISWPQDWKITLKLSHKYNTNLRIIYFYPQLMKL